MTKSDQIMKAITARLAEKGVLVPMRKWLEDIICTPGGVKAYKEKSNS